MGETSEFLDLIRSGDVDAVRGRLEANPRLTEARSMQGVSSILLAIYHGRRDIAEMIANHKGELDVFEATALGRSERIHELLDHDPSQAEAYSPDGFQPLGLAAFFGHGEVVDLLLAHDANVNSPSRNAQRVMPLHSALAGRHDEIARTLISHGADVNAKQAGDIHPLDEAAQNGHLELIKLLLAVGAEPAAVTAKGDTAEDIARAAGNVEAAEMIRARLYEKRDGSRQGNRVNDPET